MTRLRIAVPCIPMDGGKSGIAVYIREVVRALREAGHKVVCICEGEAPEGETDAIVLPARGAAFSMIRHLVALPRIVAKLKVDACIMPAANRRAFWRYPVPTVAVIHDLSQFRVADKYDRGRMLYVRRILPHFVRKAHQPVAISQSTAADVAKWWGIGCDRLSVVYNGFTTPVRIESAEARNAIFYLSRLEHPGKNHVRLIEAYEKLDPQLAAAHPLVFAGGDWNGAEEVHRRAEVSPYREHIKFLGFVAKAEIPGLWAQAKCFAFPSLSEGFGLPLLEAMSLGVPCICSSTSSLGELGKGASLQFDPENSEEIAAALKRVLTEDNTALIEAGKARAAEFSWKKCAGELAGLLTKAEVFGVRIDCVRMAEAIAQIAERGSEAGKKPQFVSFVNAHALNIAWSDREFAGVLNGADLVLPDGSGVRMAGRKLGFAVPENVNGTDMLPLLCRELAERGKTLFLLGAAPGVAERAAENLRKEHPGLKIAGTCDGYCGEEAMLAAANAAKADVLMVAMGMPLQEKWIARNLDRLECGTVMAVGGLFDFASGRIVRAPEWMRRAGLEWLWRLKCEPLRLFKRYVIGNPLFVMRLRRGQRGRR